MKNRKGFTLIELLAIILILGIIVTLVMPRINGNTSKNKEREYEKTVSMIENASKYYFSLNKGASKVYISTLQKEKYLTSNIKNPKSGEMISGCVRLLLDENGINKYEYDSECLSTTIALTVDFNGGESTQVIEGTYTDGEIVELIEPTKKNQKFSHWSVVEGNSRVVGNKIIIGTEDTVVRAEYQTTVTLIVNLNGGISGQTFKKGYRSGEVLRLQTPNKAGYTFTGWEVVRGNSTISGNTLVFGTQETEIIANYSESIWTTPGSYEYTIGRTGYYRIELWGAEGGDSKYTTQYYGGKGGYTSGYTYLESGTTLHVYVGGKGGGATGTSSGTADSYTGYNGGGYGSITTSNSTHGGGGGATDIRLVGGSWDDSSSLNSRIMVAGGGGGSSSHTSTPKYSGTGGLGGSLVGGNGTSANATCYSYGNGGTQLDTGGHTTCATDGKAYGSGSGTTTYALAGGFGLGANYNSYKAGSSSGTYYTDGGGGGGYYGGAAGWHAPGGGGSSFISGYAGVNAITNESDRTHTNNTIHYSNTYFKKAKMEAGINPGNGRAIITYVSEPLRVNTDLNDVRYVRDCINGNTNTSNDINGWNELEVIKNGINIAKGKTVTSTGTIRASESNAWTLEALVNGDIDDMHDNLALEETGLQCVTVDLGATYDVDEIAVWHVWEKNDGRIYNDNVTYVSSDNELWIPVINKFETETSIGKRVSAWDSPLEDNEPRRLYNGSYQVFTAPKTGYYKVEAWGAQGGSYGTTILGGLGAYTSGYINLEAGEKLYYYLGGQPTVSTAPNYSVGGYNGGGNSGYNATTDYSRGGGGATDIRYFGNTTPTDVDLAWDSTLGLNSRIMVAAGGGGAANGGSSYMVSGAAGGTLYGNDGVSSYNAAVPQGGKQNTYGVGKHTEAIRLAGFGFGGGKQAAGTGTGWGGGGGAGYYGGALGFGFPGAGGSSFISGYAGVNAITSESDRTHTNNTVHYSGKYFIDGEMQPGINSGNGKVKITYINATPTKTNTKLNNVRYIKDCLNGNTHDDVNRWNEIQAIKDGVNIAKGKTPVMEDGGTITKPEYITDGDIGLAGSTDTYSTSKCVVIDLENTYNLDEIAVWHNYNSTYGYIDPITYVSSNNNDWVAVMAEPEVNSSDGRRITAWDEEPNYNFDLPSEYQRVEYIESSGTQYIDTLYKPSPKTRLDVDYQFTATTQQQRIFGTDSDSTSNPLSYAVYINGSDKWAYAYQNGKGNWVSTDIARNTNRHRLRFNLINAKIIFDSTSKALSGGPTNTSTYNMTIFARNNMGSVGNYASLRIYDFKMYENLKTVRKFVPCYRKSDNEIGLYDLIEQKFYTNQGTGTFVKGADIN